jgi:hypothetical protein
MDQIQIHTFEMPIQGQAISTAWGRVYGLDIRKLEVHGRYRYRLVRNGQTLDYIPNRGEKADIIAIGHAMAKHLTDLTEDEIIEEMIREDDAAEARKVAKNMMKRLIK